MRIALFQTGPLAPGGAEFVVHHTATRLTEMGNDVTVFVGNHLFKKNPKPIYEIYRHSYRVHRFTCPIVKGLSRPWAQWNLLKTVKSSGCDIVHAHTLHTSGYLAVRIRRMLNIPVLVTGHGEDIQIDRALGYGYRLQKRHDNAVRYALRNADGATAISGDMAREMVEAGADNERIWVIPNGITNSSLEIAKPLVRTKPYLLAMGRLVQKKGFDVLIKAFSQVRQSGINGCDLLIAGDGPEKENLQSLAGMLRLGDCVHFTGFLSETEKARALSGARLFICPSLREPFGIVNLEAMAAGRAIIASNVDGIPDLIQQGNNGLLFPAGDDSVLSAHIQTLLGNPELTRQMGVAGQIKAAEYTWDKIAAKYMNVYTQLVEGVRR